MNIKEETLIEKDLKSLTMAIYRERRKEYPNLPKSRDDGHNTMDVLELQTNKKESFCLINSKEHGIVILSFNSNFEALCTKASELFINGTFSYCPKYFEQLYTFHGFKLGHYLPLVFVLLPSKSEEIYTVLLNMISSLCTDRNIMFKPRIVHIDFEIAMHNAFRSVFTDTRIECCRFHLGQSWWRKIQKLGLSDEYKNKECEIGLWLTKFFGLAFLDPTTVGDCLAEEMFEDVPNDQRCMKESGNGNGELNKVMSVPNITEASCVD
ncbi:unnamed protein product [Mytilus coruscus]|uniref:MULE transposase domain-containing protein n=1 Tax=Mytilus coruscus TaxID=42192 RepID=A0A6J8BNE8_MYTCO|nr:unnamed protein product [Mytilus coruscus]